jgi:hypothetical protein
MSESIAESGDEMSSSSGNNKQTTAVADAIAGVVGSVISTIVFYPVDVWKTSRQTSTTATSTADSYNEGEGGGCATTAESKIPTTGIVKHNNDDNINRRLLFLQWGDNLLSFLKLQRQSYYRGLSYKIIHIVASSFVYNYVHSLLSSEYISYCHRQRQRQRQRRRQCHGRRSRRSFNETAMTEKQQQQQQLLDEGNSNDDNTINESAVDAVMQ